MTSNVKESPYKGSGQITREQFLFYEMRTTADLMRKGYKDSEVIELITKENLFQYPTERSVRQIAKACITRLRGLDSEELIEAIADQSAEVAKQICMYAMMRRYRLVWDFMVSVIGEKYRTRQYSFGKMDIHVFFMQLQEQDDYVAGWSDSTVKKIGQVLTRILVENEYLHDFKTDHIDPVLLSPILKQGIHDNHDERALPAFNCFCGEEV